MLFDEKDLQSWKDDIKRYYSEKKEKSVEPVKINKITHKDVKQKETLYHPILQKYHQDDMEKKAVLKEEFQITRMKDKKMESIKKYDQKYDIITIENKPNCGKIEEQGEKLKKVLLSSNQVDYNIITNENTSEAMFQNYEKIPSKFVEISTFRGFKAIQENIKKEAQEKFQKKRDFNCLTGQFYDPNKEKTFQEKREEEQKTHGKNFSTRFPPSWKFRETVIMDPTKEVPEEIKVIDLQKKMKKKRFELRYNLEQQYREKDIENQERTKFRIRNKVNIRKYTDEYNKGFDIITLGNIPEHAANIEKYIHHKPFATTWEKLQMTSHNNFQKNKTEYQPQNDTHEKPTEIAQVPLQAIENQPSN